MATVLFVDDERNIREAFARELELEGYQVLTACEPAEALRILARKDVDLVVTDIRMPGDVRDLLRWLDEREPSVPVVIHSGDLHAFPGHVAGLADALVDKADGYEALLEAVRGLLARRARTVRQDVRGAPVGAHRSLDRKVGGNVHGASR